MKLALQFGHSNYLNGCQCSAGNDFTASAAPFLIDGRYGGDDALPPDAFANCPNRQGSVISCQGTSQSDEQGRCCRLAMEGTQ